MSHVYSYGEELCQENPSQDIQKWICWKQAVKGRKIKVSVAATKFNIPQSTLNDHVKGDKKIGARIPTILSYTEEIVVSLQLLQEMRFGLTKELTGIVIMDYLHDQPYRPNQFKDGLPGKDGRGCF